MIHRCLICKFPIFRNSVQIYIKNKGEKIIGESQIHERCIRKFSEAVDVPILAIRELMGEDE